MATIAAALRTDWRKEWFKMVEKVLFGHSGVEVQQIEELALH